MYQTFIRLGYDKDFAMASKNNWGLDGLTIAKIVAEASHMADQKAENKISREWFEAYRDAFQELIRKASPLLEKKSETEKENKELKSSPSVKEAKENLSGEKEIKKESMVAQNTESPKLEYPEELKRFLMYKLLEELVK